MCGRFTRSKDYFSEHANQRAFLDQLGLSTAISIPPSFNLAPTQEVAAVRASRDGDERELVMLRWGLVPGWAPGVGIGGRMINARAETVAEKPAFRNAFKKRRCLIVADGFYEWQKTDRSKQPYFIWLTGGQPFCFAGLWERRTRDEKSVESCTIVTTAANRFMERIHDRMPVILEPADYGLWLDSAVQEPERLTPLLRPYPEDKMEAHPVSTLVNSPKNNVPECLDPQG